MPQERYAITDFSRGIIKRADGEDIPDNAATDSNNIDADAPEGVLQAIPTASTKTLGTTSLTGGRLFSWIKTKDSKWNLVYADAGYLNVVTDFYGATPASYFGATDIATTATSMVTHNEEVRVANGVSTGVPTSPTWIGYCDYGHFGGSVKAWQYASAGISRPTYSADHSATFDIDIVGHNGSTTFDATKKYYYNISLVYDGIQESPIGNSTAWYSIVLHGQDYDYVTLTVTLNTVASLNARVTGIKIYRRYETASKTALSDSTLWKLQQSIDVTNTVGYVDRTGANISWGTSGAHKTIVYVDNNTDVLSSYEEQTSIPESLTSSDVYYSLNCDLNGYHFVAGCVKTGLPDAAMMAFRSKQHRYDMFDWTNDYLKLPTVPTAWVAFAGKIWAFDENNIYRINPDGFYIEDTTLGVGCLSQRSIKITDYGMFWCDAKNAYWYDGEVIRPIGDAIKAEVTSSTHWHEFSFDYTVGSQTLTPIVEFHSPKNLILFIVPNYASSNGDSNVWAFHVNKQRWDKWSAFTACGASTVGFGAFSGKNGEVYIATGSSLVEGLGGATWRAFYWTSKIWDFGKPALTKMFYELNTDTTSTTAAPTFTYGINRATPSSSLTTGEFITGGDYETGKLLQIKITEATGYGNKVYSFEILLRKFFEL